MFHELFHERTRPQDRARQGWDALVNLFGPRRSDQTCGSRTVMSRKRWCPRLELRLLRFRDSHGSRTAIWQPLSGVQDQSRIRRLWQIS
jgi:hypothetical protein